MSSGKCHWGFLALIGLVVVLHACAFVRQAQIDQMIANARTAEDHEAIAAAYEKEATTNREEAATHLKIAQSYDRRPRWKFDYSKICRRMAQDYARAAKEDSELAAEHRKMAEAMRAATAGAPKP